MGCTCSLRTVFSLFAPPRRLLSLAKSSLTDKKYVAGQHSEADPEQGSGLFSFLTGGGRTLPDRWAVSDIKSQTNQNFSLRATCGQIFSLNYLYRLIYM